MDTIGHIKEFMAKKPTPEQFQKVVSALRGPDWVVPNQHGYLPSGGLEKLKKLTTGRIRGIVTPGYFGTVNKEPLSQEQQYLRDEWLNYAPSHFTSHYREAVEAIRAVYGWDLKDEKAVEQE